MKTNIRRLDSLTHNDTAATKLINDNFSELQQGVEDALSRSGKTPNFMDASLDMNIHRIINIADPVDDYDLANKHYVDTTASTLQNAITAETERALLAEGTLSGAIVAEETRAKAAEKAITDTLETYGDIVTHDVDEFATAAQGALADTALQPADLGDATLTIKKNSTTVGTFTANSKTDTDINITVPTTAAEVSALPDSTKYGSSISLSLDGSTYVLTIQLKDQNGDNLGTASTVDLPLESVIVSGSYDDTTKSIILVLDSGDTITIPVGDLVSGLQSEITSNNMLDADLVNDSTSTNKFVTTSEKSTWSGKQDALTFDSTPTDNSTNPVTSGGVYTALTGKQSVIDSSHKLSADLVDDTSTTNKFVTASEKTLIGTAIQPADITNMQVTTNLVTSVSSSSTDSQYPSAKLFYDTVGDIESLLHNINSGE